MNREIKKTALVTCLIVVMVSLGVVGTAKGFDFLGGIVDRIGDRAYEDNKVLIQDSLKEALQVEEFTIGASADFCDGSEPITNLCVYDIFDLTAGLLTTGGGKHLATTTNAVTYTLIQADLESYAYIDVMNNKETLTWTMPATSTMIALLPDVGSQRTWLISNATNTAARPIIISAGAGMDLVTASSTDYSIDASGYGNITCTQIYYRDVNDQNIACVLQENGI